MIELLHLRPADGTLFLFLLLLGWSLYRTHRGHNDFNLLDLLMENGRVSRLACLIMGAFAITSWQMIRLTLDGKLTEGYFTAYGGIWIAPLIAKMFAPPNQGREGP